MVSQVDSLVKEQLTVDSLVKKLRGEDCGCTNSGDGDAGNWSAVCVVGKSCGRDFQDEKRDNDCCDDLNEMYRSERKKTNEETEDCYVPDEFVPVVPVTSTLTEVCYVPEASLERRLSGRSAETACPINGCAEENSARHYLFVCQTAMSSSQQQPDQLEKEKAAPEKNSADAFVRNTLPSACDSHGSTST
ncbi:hypothetical protein Bpfe_007006 [Biomphalaria pfeifferi]|uniref:Uncharacterized protein n=1 Tax=Biomphalaria pfeifferi TaxID=112525 RepID=A0AAD8FGC1_BIOPF|nr:hypothetical protein Bpfe_007006 [Biomphalaria pfeifferi]